MLINWLVMTALIGAWYALWRSWTVLAPITAVAVIYTMGRAARLVPARRAVVATAYGQTQAAFGHPRPTAANPVDPASRVQVLRWRGRRTPRTAAVAYSTGSAAAIATTRWQAEKVIEDNVPRPVGTEWVFDWRRQPGWVLAEAVPESDPRIQRKSDQRWISSTFFQIFKTPKPDAFGFDVVIERWQDRDDFRQIPELIRFQFGAFDASNPQFRDQAERTFDRQVERGVEWLHDWSTPGEWVVSGVPPASSLAVRKRVSRKVSDLVTALVRTPRSTATVTVTVSRWLDRPEHPRSDTPIEICVDFGTFDVAPPQFRTQFGQGLDQALEAEWTDRVWLYDWTFGHSSQVVLAAVPARHPRALRKQILRQLRSVVIRKFPARRGQTPPDVIVHEWVSATRDDGSAPVERPQRLEVIFGTVDVTAYETRRAFEDHFDSQTIDNDWNYRWSIHQGLVEITAVPTLPSYLAFPEEGTKEFERWMQEFRDGRIILGPAKGGYEGVIDLSKVPHTLVGGNTGSGKSVLLTMILLGALWNPDRVDLIVVDPKVTDFTWTPGYPNVIIYAVRNAATAGEEIHQAVKHAHDEMVRRQNLLSRHGVENLGELRRLAELGTVDIQPSEIPKRLIVFFDELGAAFTPSKNKDVKAIQDDARTMMEQIGMLGRAMEVNIVGAAQKPSDKDVGTLLRQLMGNRIGIGWLESTTSVQVLGNDLCYKSLPKEDTPKGRGWVCTEGVEPRLVQSYFLPKRNTPDLRDPGMLLSGVQERVARRLESVGFRAVQLPTTFRRPQDDGQLLEEVVLTSRWVRAGDLEAV